MIITLNKGEIIAILILNEEAELHLTFEGSSAFIY